MLTICAAVIRYAANRARTAWAGPHLVHVLAPHQIAHLRTGVDTVEPGACERVPKADATVGGAAAAREKPVLNGSDEGSEHESCKCGALRARDSPGEATKQWL